MTSIKINPFIFGISGTKLTNEEIDVFTQNPCRGFILFARNIESRIQLKELTSSLRNIYPGHKIAILIDQEGGRVARIKPPIANKLYPSAESLTFGYEDNPEEVKELVKSNYYELTQELKALGIDSSCTPVCDIRYPDSNKVVIGDRSFGNNVNKVVDLTESAISGILSAKGLPCIKHIPGHGRSLVDSHYKLPYVNATLEELQNTDFKIFQELSTNINNDQIWGMTAHIIYTALDDQNPATLSEDVIKYIRSKIGFKGTLITDDIGMLALHGDLGRKYNILNGIIKSVKNNKPWKGEILLEYKQNFSDSIEFLESQEIIKKCNNHIETLKPSFVDSIKRVARLSLEAGCDIVLHCSGEISEIKAIYKILI